MTLPVETFQEREAKRRERKSVQDGRDAINGFIHSEHPPASTPASREFAELERQAAEVDAKIAGLDQGSRGGAAREPEAPQDANSWMRQALREGREGNG